MIGSTSKTVSLGWFTGLAVSGGKGSGICGMSRGREFPVRVRVSDIAS